MVFYLPEINFEPYIINKTSFKTTYNSQINTCILNFLKRNFDSQYVLNLDLYMYVIDIYCDY